MSLPARFLFPSATKGGSILVLALWMISIISIFALSSGYQARQKAELADRIDRRNWLNGLAETGIYQAILKIKQKKETAAAYHSLNDPFTNDRPSFKNKHLGQGAFTVSYDYRDPDDGSIKIRYGAQDEEQKINFNTAKPEIMSRLIQMISGMDEDGADEIAYSIVDWRDENSTSSHPKYGAEDDYYEDLDVPYESKDFNLESIDELLLIRGMTPELFEKIKPYVTVFGDGTININTTSKEVLLVLGMNESLADKILSFRKGLDREEGTDDDRVFMNSKDIADQLNQVHSISSGDVSLISQLIANDQLNVSSSLFMIQSRGEISQKKQALDMIAIADLDGKIYFWQSTGIPRRMTPIEIKNADAD